MLDMDRRFVREGVRDGGKWPDELTEAIEAVRLTDDEGSSATLSARSSWFDELSDRTDSIEGTLTSPPVELLCAFTALGVVSKSPVIFVMLPVAERCFLIVACDSLGWCNPSDNSFADANVMPTRLGPANAVADVLRSSSLLVSGVVGVVTRLDRSVIASLSVSAVV